MISHTFLNQIHQLAYFPLEPTFHDVTHTESG